MGRAKAETMTPSDIAGVSHKVGKIAAKITAAGLAIDTQEIESIDVPYTTTMRDSIKGLESFTRALWRAVHRATADDSASIVDDLDEE